MLNLKQSHQHLHNTKHTSSKKQHLGIK